MNKDFLMSLKRGLEKRVLPSVLAGSLLFGADVSEANAFSFDAPTTSYSEFLESDIKIFINGRLVESNPDLGYPEVKNGRTYIPVRVVSETYNAYVAWDSKRQEAIVSKHGEQITVPLGEKYIKKADDITYYFKTNRLEMDAESYAKDGRIYIPLRALFEAYDMTVTWDGNTKTIYAVGDYTKNTEYIDFKDYNVMEMKDLDVTKDYSKIVFDGEVIVKEYLNILKNCNEYKIIEDSGVLNIFSYQYLFDLNYLYKAHSGRKYNVTDNTTEYPLWSISEEEYEFAKNIELIDDRFLYSNTKFSDEGMNGMYYSYVSSAFNNEYVEIDKVVNQIISKVNLNAKSEEDKVKIVNEELKKIIDYGYPDSNVFYGYLPVYRALVNPNLVVCDGYAVTFKYIMDKIGIDCLVIRGTNTHANEPHAWNEVLINGEWKVVDVTTNDASYDNVVLLSDYLNIDFLKPYEVDAEDVQLVKYTLKLNNAN